MPRLQPLNVPWQISPSTPELSVRTKSLEGVNHGLVTFIGCLGEDTQLKRKYGENRQIGVILERMISLRLYPEFSTDDTERLDNYDWDLVLRLQDKENCFKNHYRMFHDQWNTTDICPNPAAYLVEGSDWLLRLGFSPDAPPHLQFQHYLFVGNDYNVELIAKSLKWEIVESDVEASSVESSVECGIART